MGARIVPTAVLLFLAVVSSSCTYQAHQVGYVDGLVPVVFTYENLQARDIVIAGSFNGWSPASHPMVQKGDTWTAEIALKPGRYTYAFVVDGSTWLSDPAAPFWEDSGFGPRSSVLIVE